MSIAWVGHVVGSAVVHALVYILAWRLLRHASIVTVLGLLVLVVVALLVLGLLTRRRRW
ncbi:MAG: hypothetical protein RE468_02015 [Acidithiobacillus caldus]|jgi:hypothetical protein|uniref:hypothetical protein n=1 Tax=Acidithiobacillus caldus TaxID=33059 RepID=UPI001C079224|nr:hypothetical protein [Acidithiobacillus caldus]MBU2790751.1 hypothetical protein [Acidithiobacillus caldus]MBU2820160.1 hypothetical protein [Acidithiobacillus caldus]WMT47429.1 MAG: hypothetical protein RE468_02015 [Acidithiobacillus caldus]